MSKAIKCPECKAGPFQGKKGLEMHRIRKHTNNFWATTGVNAKKPQKASKKRKSRRTTAANEPLKDGIYDVLREHPDGISVTQLAQEMQKRGYRKKTKARNLANYIATYASKDDNISRPERGIYKLKDLTDAFNAATSSSTEVATPATTAPPPTVGECLIRIAHLEAQVLSLKNGLSATIRNIGDE